MQKHKSAHLKKYVTKNNQPLFLSGLPDHNKKIFFLYYEVTEVRKLSAYFFLMPLISKRRLKSNDLRVSLKYFSLYLFVLIIEL